MNLLLVSPYFPPQNAVASRRTHAFAACWAKQGEHVTVLTTAKRANQQGLVLPLEQIELVEVKFSAPTWVEALRERHRDHDASSAHSPSDGKRFLVDRLKRIKERSGVYGSVRMPDLTDHWIGPALRWCERSSKTFDVVISSSGPYTAHLVAMRIKQRGLARSWVADFRDLWTDNHIFTGMFPFTIRERQLERQCLRHADLLVTVTEGLAAALQRKCKLPVEVIYNGFDRDEGTQSSRSARPSTDRMELVYTGTTYPQGQDPAPLLIALKNLKSIRPHIADRLQLTIAGKGSEHWMKLAQAEQVREMITSPGIISQSAALEMQQHADALILLDWKKPEQGVLTGKVFEYLNASAPILIIGGCPDSPIAKMVLKAGRGIHLGNDVKRIEQALADLVQGSVAPQPNLEFIQSFTRQTQSMRLLEFIRAIWLSLNRAPS